MSTGQVALFARPLPSPLFLASPAPAVPARATVSLPILPLPLRPTPPSHRQEEDACDGDDHNPARVNRGRACGAGLREQLLEAVRRRVEVGVSRLHADADDSGAKGTGDDGANGTPPPVLSGHATSLTPY